MARRAISLAVILSISISSPALADGGLAKLAEKLKRGDSLTVRYGMEQPVSGRLHGFDMAMENLTITQQFESQIQTINFKDSEISSVRFRKPGKFQLKYAFLGTVLGVAAGYLASKLGETNSHTVPYLPNDYNISYPRFELGDDVIGARGSGLEMLIGGFVGLVGGTIVGTELPSEHNFKCEF